MIQIKTIVTCDHCTGSYTYSRAPYTKAKFNHIVNTLKQSGWLIEKLGTHAWRVLCSDCAKNPKVTITQAVRGF